MDDKQKIKELSDIKNEFTKEFAVLKDMKDSLFKQFRKKLEEKKIEEIKKSI